MWPGRTLDEVVRILKINLNQLFFFIFTNKLIEVMQCSVQLKLTHPLSVRILKPQASLASQTQPTPAQTDSSCLILKAIRAGVGWVWLARLALGMVLFFFCDIDRAKQTTSVSCVVTMGNLRECLICYYLSMLFSITPSIGYSGARWVNLTNQKDAAYHPGASLSEQQNASTRTYMRYLLMISQTTTVTRAMGQSHKPHPSKGVACETRP